MNTYNNRRITETDIIELESWLMYIHRDYNNGNIEPKQQEILSKMVNLIRPQNKNPKFKKK